MSSDLLKCLICEDPSYKKNPIIKCATCEFSAHVCCYGIVVRKNFKCSPCLNDVDVNTINCELCLQKNGAMKKTTNGKWAHVICGLIIPDCVFQNCQKMEPIDISKVKPNKKNDCVFCHEKGTTVKCNIRECKNFLHASCGLLNKTIVETLTKQNKISFNGYCNEHRVTKDKKRLSSERVVQVVGTKMAKIDATNAEKRNSNWIMKQLNSTESMKYTLHL